MWFGLRSTTVLPKRYSEEVQTSKLDAIYVITFLSPRYFEYQLKLSESVNKPLFLHCRNAADDLYEIICKYPNLRGVIHSFDGTSEEALRFIDIGYYIGLNGW